MRCALAITDRSQQALVEQELSGSVDLHGGDVERGRERDDFGGRCDARKSPTLERLLVGLEFVAQELKQCSVEVAVVRAPEPVAPEPPPVVPLPRLQGIFYSPTAPSAIMDGKTIRPGDTFKQYKVKAITKFNVILVGPDKKEIKVGLGS